MKDRKSSNLGCSLLVAVAASVFPQSAGHAAEPWEGAWTESGSGVGCTVPLIEISEKTSEKWMDYFRQFDDSTPDDFLGQIVLQREGPFVCYITKVTGIRDLDGWIFDLACSGEGNAWSKRGIVLRTPNVWSSSQGWREDPHAIAAYNITSGRLGGEVVQLFRCSK